MIQKEWLKPENGFVDETLCMVEIAGERWADFFYAKCNGLAGYKFSEIDRIWIVDPRSPMAVWSLDCVPEWADYCEMSETGLMWWESSEYDDTIRGTYHESHCTRRPPWLPRKESPITR